MLPAFENGQLPPGVHTATLAEVEARFGWNPWRVGLLGGFRRAVRDLSRGGCRRVWLNGSFVTEKDLPEDFDMCWDMDGVDFEELEPALLDLGPPRALQKATYGGDILPNVVEGGSGQPFVEFFQQDAVTGFPRGIVVIDLGALS